MWSKNVSFESGVLHLSGIPAAKLAQEFGTPAFFLDEDAFKSRALAWNNGLRDQFGERAGTIFTQLNHLSALQLPNGLKKLESELMCAQVAN